jgi:catechol 2,3-dioxygenase-like lactoylglutathione lyase family enzyme
VIVGLDHVQIAIPPRGEHEARTFYVYLLGFREVQKPHGLVPRGGLWLTGGSDGALAIHLGVDSDFRPARKAHPGLLVDDLDPLRERLVAAGVPTRDDDVDVGVRRFYADDPFGNRLELIDARDRGFTNR